MGCQKQIFIQGWLYPCHTIAYIPVADSGQNWQRTQAKLGFLKPFPQRCIAIETNYDRFLFLLGPTGKYKQNQFFWLAPIW